MIVLILILCAIGAWYVWPSHPQTAFIRKPTHIATFDTTLAKKMVVPEIYRAVGTIKPTTESNLESIINAKIIKVPVSPGQNVKAGELLVELDDRDVIARVERSEQEVQAAQAIHDQSLLAYKRSENLVKSGYISKSQFDKAKSNYLSAIARLRQAEKSLQEAKVNLSHSKITAIADGTILDKFVDPGDQAMPGKVLLKMQTTEGLQLSANVPEELIRKVYLGQELPIVVDALGEQLTGSVAEIVPNIDPKTRTFIVKVNLPEKANIYPGMFGRALIPVAQKQIIAIPKSSIIKQGQLEFVHVVDDERVQKVIITTGKPYGDLIQVLSGLNEGDLIVNRKP